MPGQELQPQTFCMVVVITADHSEVVMLLMTKMRVLLRIILGAEKESEKRVVRMRRVSTLACHRLKSHCTAPCRLSPDLIFVIK